MTSDAQYEVDFEWEEDNPLNWPTWYKTLIIFVMSYSTTCVVLTSTSFTSAIPGLEKSFGISDAEGILGVTTYLLGIAVGALFLAPLSEMYGRKPCYVVSLALFLVFVAVCAEAQNMATILTIRFFSAFCASAMISNAPGSVNDIVTEKYRALAFSIWSIGPANGPVLGPVIGGFVYQYLGWRWTFWVVVAAAGSAWLMVSAIKETYTPAILRKRAAKLRKETGDERYHSAYDNKLKFGALLKVNLSRPFIMAATEPICMFWDIYIALVYGILYLCFVAYPIVFGGLRGWSSGFVGLSFVGIGVGGMIAIVCEPLIRKWIDRSKPDADTPPPPEAMVSVVCLGAILIPAGQIWFSWTCTPNVHWIWPIVAGIPFGCGNNLVFIYASAYLVHSYDIFAASALAGNAVLRSIMGATLPLAAPPLFAALGPNWGGTLLGMLEVVCIPIPFIFYRYGAKIRGRSKLIRAMRENKEKAERKKRKADEKVRKRAEADAAEAAGMATGAAVVESVVIETDLEKGGKK
ncbi:major facilitator superfamily domain-containing protein [Neohortaea acidophila]|uniref:Cercosporin MFS transporter CTB4 n=1 Tax=Neohortaea acidophila TaxID=245834 RepID=A0A6A6PY76_9PEZI|nr:major facilitator superfamily domain-containing protein [Neohortaea acidophila]KAF2485070.1 major facilitator superfamily domain-containing protein [Neohortaea acidophila]